jgi:hypothetical protein
VRKFDDSVFNRQLSVVVMVATEWNISQIAIMSLLVILAGLWKNSLPARLTLP